MAIGYRPSKDKSAGFTLCPLIKLAAWPSTLAAGNTVSQELHGVNALPPHPCPLRALAATGWSEGASAWSPWPPCWQCPPPCSSHGQQWWIVSCLPHGMRTWRPPGADGGQGWGCGFVMAESLAIKIWMSTAFPCLQTHQPAIHQPQTFAQLF